MATLEEQIQRLRARPAPAPAPAAPAQARPPAGSLEEQIERLRQKMDGAPPAEPPAPVEPVPLGVRDWVGGVANEALQGLTFGHGDELRGLLHGAAAAATGQGDFRETAQRVMDEGRARQDRFREAHPVTATGANLVSGMLVPGMGMAKAGASTVSNLGRMIGGGALGGALGGAGEADGTLADRAQGATMGGTTGAILTGLMAPAGVAATGITKRVLDALGKRDPVAQADEHMLRAMRRGEVVPEQAIERLQGTDKPLAPVDLAPSMQRLGRTIEAVPGRAQHMAQEFLHGRQADMPARVADDISSNLGGASYKQTFDGLRQSMEERAGPLYAQAREQPYAGDSEIESLLQTDAGRRAAKHAKDIASNRRTGLDTLGIQFDEAGNPVYQPTMGWEGLQLVKQGLDTELGRYRDQFGRLNIKGNPKAGSVLDVRNALNDRMRQLNEPYRQANDIWAGGAQAQDAMELGRDFLRGRDQEAALESFRRLTPGEREAFRLGVSQELRDSIGNQREGSNVIARFWNVPNQRARLRELFDTPEQWQAFERSMDEETLMNRTRQAVTGGSVTGRIAAEQDDAAGLATDIVTDMVTGGPWTLATRMRQGARAATGIPEPVAEELAQRLFTSDKGEQARVLMEMSRRGVLRQAMQDERVRRVVAGLIGGSSTIGQMGAPDEEPAQR